MPHRAVHLSERPAADELQDLDLGLVGKRRHVGRLQRVAHLLDLLHRAAGQPRHPAALAVLRRGAAKDLDKIELAHEQRVEPRLLVLQLHGAGTQLHEREVPPLRVEEHHEDQRCDQQADECDADLQREHPAGLPPVIGHQTQLPHHVEPPGLEPADHLVIVWAGALIQWEDDRRVDADGEAVGGVAVARAKVFDAHQAVLVVKRADRVEQLQQHRRPHRDREGAPIHVLHAVDHARLAHVAARVGVEVRVGDVADDAVDALLVGADACAGRCVRHGEGLVEAPRLIDVGTG
mmetsp:Transcript_26367/g.78277  ORF Transcript_26367/g.78277 Transcript_26367/m.78277 type:complete len:292 (-) Transcript_26367:1114-1989(-)